MYYLQSDSSEIDMEYTKRFYSDIMPAKEFYRTKLFAFEVSKEAKDPLFFHYSIGSQKFPIIPGMVAEVDILTGKKSVLAYLMKPILRAKAKAMTER